MKRILRLVGAVAVGLGVSAGGVFAQTDGTARFQATLVDLTASSSTAHFAVGWVTKSDGTFIKTLWKQGPVFGASDWNDHCTLWNTNRAGSTVVDGFSGATAANYNPTANNPVILNWNCRDLSNTLVPDGTYKFWVQYAENTSHANGQGPWITNGISWVKGPAGLTTHPADISGRFINMTNTWNPLVVTEPTITSVRLNGNTLVMSGTGTPSGTYRVLFGTDVTQPVANWTPIKTNSLDAGGNYTYTTDPISPAVPRGFYKVRSP